MTLERLMRTIRGYKLELCWLVLVMLLALAPVASAARKGWNHDDEADDCGDNNGWCLPQLF